MDSGQVMTAVAVMNDPQGTADMTLQDQDVMARRRHRRHAGSRLSARKP